MFRSDPVLLCKLQGYSLSKPGTASSWRLQLLAATSWCLLRQFSCPSSDMMAAYQSGSEPRSRLVQLRANVEAYELFPNAIPSWESRSVLPSIDPPATTSSHPLSQDSRHAVSPGDEEFRHGHALRRRCSLFRILYLHRLHQALTSSQLGYPNINSRVRAHNRRSYQTCTSTSSKPLRIMY